MIRIVCASDLHLGRKLSNLPCDCTHLELGPVAAWKNLVGFATDRSNGVDAVVIAGDLIDSDYQFFEVVHRLKEGIEKLLSEKIPVIVIAGNHDSQVLVKLHLAIQNEGFYILGKEGNWETVSLVIKGKKVRFDGWSFPTTHVGYSPLERYSLPKVNPGEIALGLLHCDLFSNLDGEYAPVDRSHFLSHHHTAWILGHIHKPQVIHSTPLTFYCGSVQGLDRSEIDIHGFYMLEIENSNTARHTMIGVASLEYREVVIDVEGIKKEEFELELIRALSQLLIENRYCRAVGVKLELKGKTAFYRDLPQMTADLPQKVIYTGLGGVLFFIEEVVLTAQPHYDLEELAQGSDPVALLAKSLALQSGGLQHKEVIFDKVKQDYRFLCSTQIEEPSEDKLKQIGLKTGFYLLDRLIGQRNAR